MAAQTIHNPIPGIRSGPPFRRMFRAAKRVMVIWRQRSIDRRQLAEMSDTMRRGMGVSRADLERETAKPFWRP